MEFSGRARRGEARSAKQKKSTAFRGTRASVCGAQLRAQTERHRAVLGGRTNGSTWMSRPGCIEVYNAAPWMAWRISQNPQGCIHGVRCTPHQPTATRSWLSRDSRKDGRHSPKTCTQNRFIHSNALFFVHTDRNYKVNCHFIQRLDSFPHFGSSLFVSFVSVETASFTLASIAASLSLSPCFSQPPCL